MKKFLIIVFTIIAIYFLYDLAYYHWGFYMPSTKKPNVISSINYKNLEMNSQSFIVKGVNVGSSLPGKYSTDYSISYDTYYSWFESIAKMGANTVRINSIYNDDFYNALYNFNAINENKLYLIQGISLDTYALNSHIDGYSKNYYGELVNQAENAVDVIHGRKKLTLSQSGKGTYRKNISKYLLGYIVGSEWMEDTIMHTNKKYKDKNAYDGNYITTNEANAFEVMLAKVIDHLITYETKKYGEQHNVSFINSIETDPISEIPTLVEGLNDTSYLSPSSIKYFYHKMVKLDMQHLKGKNGYQGLFASYNVSSYDPYYLKYTYEQYEDSYKEYLKKITEHHTMPVLITEFGYSTSRGVSAISDDKYGNFGGMTEEEQGNAIINAYHTILESGTSGGIIATWQDEWNKQTSNTIEKVDINNNIYWGDVQTSTQGSGILTFDPGKEKSIVYVDGDTKEWNTEDIILNNTDLSLSVKQDERYLYLYIDKKENLNRPIYIPMDITTKSGSKHAREYNLNFNRDADFLLVLNGTYGEILVQEYYNVLEAVDGYELKGKNSYANKPNKDTDDFEEINLLIEPYSNNLFSKNLKQATTVNTGLLKYGNANPSSKNYNSQADFYEQNGKIEVRIPWQILNFSDPSNASIHDDYYQNYGVDSYNIKEIFLGASYNSNIELAPYKLKPWNKKITYHERLKKSYDIIKREWRVS